MSVNEELRQQLLAMEREDQTVLQQLRDSGELAAVDDHPRMQAVRKKNASRLKRIFSQYGWPGISLVGEDGSKAAWLVAQHSVSSPDFMNSALALLKQAVTDEEAEGWCLACLHDRVLSMAGQPQIYGTQHEVDENGISRPLPLRDPRKVGWLRQGLGMAPLAEVTAKLQQDHDRTLANRNKAGENGAGGEGVEGGDNNENEASQA